MASINSPSKPITVSDIMVAPVMKDTKKEHMLGSSTSTKVTSNIKDTQKEDFKQS